MEKQNQIDKIKLEYDLYEVDKISSLEYVDQGIMTFLDEIDVLRNVINVEKNQNRRMKLRANRLGKFAPKCGCLDIWYYEQEAEFLKKQTGILNSYYDQLDQIYSGLNDDNYQELFRLMCFARKKNLEYEESVKEERKCIKISVTGEGFERVFPPEESEAFNDFFASALSAATNIEKVEKVKK